jgi:hypothetical protein
VPVASWFKASDTEIRMFSEGWALMARKKAKEKRILGRDMTTGHATLEESKPSRENNPGTDKQKDFDARVRINSGISAIAFGLLGIAYILGWSLIHPVLLIVALIGAFGLFVMTFLPRD